MFAYCFTKRNARAWEALSGHAGAGKQNVQTARECGFRGRPCRAVRFRHDRHAERNRARHTVSASVRISLSVASAGRGNGMLAARLAQFRTALSIRFKKARQRWTNCSGYRALLDSQRPPTSLPAIRPANISALPRHKQRPGSPDKFP